jgi:hypothetical protein
MAEQILLLNPRHKRRRRMPAGLARYWASRRRGHNPRRHHRRHHYRHRASNPRRHYRRHVRRHHYRRHRNPRDGIGGDIFGSYVVPGVIGAAGAIGFDILWGYVEPQLPASFQTGWVATLAELVTLWFAIKAADSMSPRNRQTIHRAGLGAATVIAYNALEGLAAQYLPAGTPGLSGYMPAARYQLGGMGRVVGGRRMAGYMPRTFSGGLAGLQDMYYSPAAVVQANPPEQFGNYDLADDGMDN